MKPLLRAVLVLDAVLYLGAGALLVLTPWTTLHRALQLVVIEPAMAGQFFGLALIGLAWLSLHGAVNGAMTAAVAKVVGHVTWLTGVLVLVWLIALQTAWAPGLGSLINGAAGVFLFVLGMGGVRLAGAVKRQDKAAVAQRAAGPATRAANGQAEARADSQAPQTPPEPQSSGSSSAAGTAPAQSASSLQSDAGHTATGDVASAPIEQGARNGAADAGADLSSAPRPPLHG